MDMHAYSRVCSDDVCIEYYIQTHVCGQRSYI